MTSLATTIALIDVGLAARYAGITVDIDGTPAAVAVLVEDPNNEEKQEKVYPSIVLNQIGEVHDTDRAESTDDEDDIITLDTGVTPNERVQRKGPLPYKVLYSLHTWHKAMASEARELCKKAFDYKTPPRGFVTVKNIDGVDIDIDVHKSGNVVSSKEKLPDTVIYHSVQTLEVLCYLTQADADDTDRHTVAMNVGWKFNKRKLIETPSGAEILEDEEVEDVQILFDATTEAPV